MGRIFISLILGASIFIIFMASPVHSLSDSNYSMLLSYQLIRHHTFKLDEYFHRPLGPITYTTLLSNGLPYQVEEIAGHIYYCYPPGSSILSLPAVAILSILGHTPVDHDHTYNIEQERFIEGIIAGLLMALSTVLIFNTAFHIVPFNWALIITIGFALGTQVWSTASRVLWTNTWSIFFSSILVFFLIKVRRMRLFEQLLIATLLSWSYFVRPQNSLMIVSVTLYLLILHGRKVIPILITGCLWLICFILYSQALYGTLLPSYYTWFPSAFAVRLEGIAGVLISPSRGIFIYVPTVAFVCFLLVRFWEYVRAIPAIPGAVKPW